MKIPNLQTTICFWVFDSQMLFSSYEGLKLLEKL